MTALRRLGTGKNVIIALGVVAVLALLSHFTMVPAYRAVASGFVPMDMQFPLNRGMIAFQRGAFAPGIAEAYLHFATLDALQAVAIMVATILLWGWSAARLPDSMAGLVMASALLLSLLTALLDIGENVLFMRLVMAARGDPQHTLTVIGLGLHGAHYVLTMVTYAITLGLIVLAALSAHRRRERPL